MDKELRYQILRASIRDRAFLTASARNLTPDMFPEKEERVIAQVALDFYDLYKEPVGSMIRNDAENVAVEQRFGSDTQKKIKEAVDHLLSGKMEVISVKALSDRVKTLKQNSFYDKAVDQVLTLQEKGELNASSFQEIVEKANRELNTDRLKISDFNEGIEERIARRASEANDKKFPLLLIDPLDEKIRIIGRGHTGLVLAPFSSGKGMFLVHVDLAYALQGLNVLHITLEDPLEEVENRLDSATTGIALNRLTSLPNKLAKKFRSQMEYMRGRIKIVDGTTEDFTVARVEALYYQLAQEDFVADAIIIDYDEYIKPSKKFSGDSARRFEFDNIYTGLTKLAAKLDVILWTAAQGTRGAEGKKVITGKDAAEDISKIRKVFFALGLGVDPSVENMKYLYVCRHRLDSSRFGVEIMADYSRGMFYDKEATDALR